ncbi:mitochondrial carrier domain-containing protein [Boletus reticuloceps]|uniref:Mitochondrial carrier domain-containing protein n=1 Tax=Boletus reticuloceps TaxID=495285 RepID=A0A8I2Z0J5_9AGAM|nr:mitochondrial carrier domain-containing protein [Boletus reticuloceps]
MVAGEHRFRHSGAQHLVLTDPPVDLDPTVDFAAGTAAGVVGLLVAHPFDTGKSCRPCHACAAILPVQSKLASRTQSIYSKYKSTLNAFVTITREERFTGLYKGVVSPLATCAFINGLVFSSYKFFMRAQLDDPASVPSLTQVGLAGTGCGIVTSLIASPTELIKIRQQNVLVNDPGNASALKVAMTYLQTTRHPRTLPWPDCHCTERHRVWNVLSDATCRYFKAPSAQPLAADHSSLLSEIDSEASSMPWTVLFLAGGLAGIAGWVATFPMDLVKTRMQSTEPSLTATKLPTDPCRTILSTVVHSYRSEGWRVFFRGLTPTLIRSVPVNVATFSVYESVVHMLS